MKRCNRPMALAAALLAAAAGAEAKVLAAGTYTPEFSFVTATAFVPLGGTAAAPKTQLKVNAGKAGTYLLTFSGECDVAGPIGSWLDIDLQVNGVVVAPTVGSADAFCSGQWPGGLGGWSHPSITTAVTLNAGSNTVRVLARLNGGATLGFIDDISLVVAP